MAKLSCALPMPLVSANLPVIPVDTAHTVRLAVAVVFLTLFWCWETWRPFLGHRQGRIRHAAHNVGIALFNTIVMGVVFASTTATVAAWTTQEQLGLLHALPLGRAIRFLLALGLLDGAMYLWHRANHRVPVLWRFHRMHHSDRAMDVTTATRFHCGEHLGAGLLRLALVPLLGLDLWHVVLYDALLTGVTQFHHADISLGRWDLWLCYVIVTPAMHKVHHSDWPPETDSNYSAVLSFWDRLGGSFRRRSDLRTLVFGLQEFTDPQWQRWWGMLKTPFVAPSARTDHGSTDVLRAANRRLDPSLQRR